MYYKDTEGRVIGINFVGNVDTYDGVGNFSIVMLKALFNIGIRASVLAAPTNNPMDLGPEAQLQVNGEKFDSQFGFFHTPIQFRPLLKTPYSAGWFGWHTSKLPSAGDVSGDYAAAMNSFTEVIAPSQYSVNLFREQGVTVPVNLIHNALDTDNWPLVERPLERSGYTFLAYGTMTETKAPDKIIEAFRKAFPKELNVRLLIATRGGILGGIGPGMTLNYRMGEDPRILVHNQGLSRNSVNDMMFKCDCGINLSRGETFAQVPCQMALSGLPVITVHHTGMAEWYNPDCFYGVDVERTSPSPYGGDWNEPDIEQTVYWMREVFNNREAAQDVGRRASAHIRANFGIEALERDLQRYFDYVGRTYD